MERGREKIERGRKKIERGRKWTKGESSSFGGDSQDV